MALVLMGICACQAPAETETRELSQVDWEIFRSQFVSEQGRVIDNVNERVSHSEGQGYGMLLAAAFDDRETFEKIWNWTRQNLQTRQKDKLFSWRWEPAADDPEQETGEGSVTDANNASDGDVLIAWALYRAGVSWERRDYYEAAREIVEEIQRLLLVRGGRAVYLLPGLEGFQEEDHLVLNLSYWIFPAFKAFHSLTGSEDWRNLNATGLALLKRARFGQWNLPPDWLQVRENEFKPAEEFPPVFSYNAIRIPLNLVWGGIDSPEYLQPYIEYASRMSLGDDAEIPATVNLKTGHLSDDKALPGMQAILKITRGQVLENYQPDLPPLAKGESYYSSALLLLAKLAQTEI